MAEQIIRKRIIDGEEYDVIYRHSVPLVYCINDIYNNSLFCQRLLIGRKNDRI